MTPIFRRVTRAPRGWRSGLAGLVASICLLLGAPGVAPAQTSADIDASTSTGGPIRLRQPASDQQQPVQTEEPTTGPREQQEQPTYRDRTVAPREQLRQPEERERVTPTEPKETSKPEYQARVREFEKYAKLPRFGTDMVAALASGAPDFSPIVPPDYLVQTGDELMVAFWGTVDADLRLVVDRSGRITIPRVGPVMVAGLRLADTPQAITRRANQVFKNFELSVTLGRLRGVRVYVTGFVRRPGAYVLSSLSTAMNAVMRAGGPSDAGSFRSIELHRGGRVAARLDLYDLLLRGDRTSDMTLQPDDVINVAALGPQVGVRGSVNRQAVYEIKPGETLDDALAMAGGFNAVADRSRLAVERLDDRNGRHVVDFKLPASGPTPLANADIVVAYSAVESAISVERQNKRIRVDGEVLHPGEYVLPPGSSIEDALHAAGGLTGAAYLYGTEFTRESVRKSQQQNYDRALRDFEVQIARAGGTQRISTAEEASALAASTAANTRLLEQLRLLRPDGRIVLHLTPQSTGLPDLALEDGDKLTIPSRPTTVGVFGSVFSGGSYLYQSGRTVGDYLGLAGGPTRGADQTSVFVVRPNGTVSSSLQSSGFFTRGVQIAGEGAEPGDTIFVPEELNKSTWVQNTKDWTAILYQFGLGVAGIKTALGW